MLPGLFHVGTNSDSDCNILVLTEIEEVACQYIVITRQGVRYDGGHGLYTADFVAT